jgi:N-acetylglucosaminyl-diphospho-decaprenol L-rhamnosyltransferase
MSRPSEARASAPTESAQSRVSVIVVTFHSAHCALHLGASLADCPHVIVVDNGSADDNLDVLRHHLPQARIIANGRNLGFGAANNRGVDAAQTEFVLLLNPDCLLDHAQITALVEAADRYPDACLIAPQLLDKQGQPEANYRWKANSWKAQGPVVDADACVGFASGACLLIRTAAMRQVGGFDENFFLYYEDDDLCLRLDRFCGPLIVTPAARVTHLSRGSSAGKGLLKAEFNRGFHHIQSKFLFDAKHKGRSTSVWRRWRFGLIATIEATLRLLLLDRRRAWRTFGRAMGVIRYRAPSNAEARLQADSKP